MAGSMVDSTDEMLAMLKEAITAEKMVEQLVIRLVDKLVER